ncbi:MAG: YitT family protein [Oscillospiraceae bacterium]|nr:YitT family protein [Oscillospiraceae bacterium]
MAKIFKVILLQLQLIAGTALTAMAMGMIIIPMNFSAAGVTGFAIVLTSFLPVSVSLLVLIINVLFLLLGLVCLGKEFLIKTVIYSVLFPVMLDFFSRFRILSIESDPVICAILAGFLLGIGVSMVIRCDASTGGFGIPALILSNKYKIPVGLLLNAADAMVILVQLVNKTPLQTVYGILTVTISAIVVDRVVTLGRGEAQFTIISRQNQCIRTALLENADVGMTSFMAETGLNQAKQTAIVTVVPYEKISEIKKTVMSIDPLAFVIISQVHSVLGKGFTLDR